jgi:hypothetical protein
LQQERTSVFAACRTDSTAGYLALGLVDELREVVGGLGEQLVNEIECSASSSGIGCLGVGAEDELANLFGICSRPRGDGVQLATVVFDEALAVTTTN